MVCALKGGICNMCYKCYNSFLAALILIFSFWMTGLSWWIIVISAGLIFLKNVYYLISEGCDTWPTKEAGSKLFMEKGSEELHEGPSKKEVKEVLKKLSKKKK